MRRVVPVITLVLVGAGCDYCPPDLFGDRPTCADHVDDSSPNRVPEHTPQEQLPVAGFDGTTLWTAGLDPRNGRADIQLHRIGPGKDDLNFSGSLESTDGGRLAMASGPGEILLVVAGGSSISTHIYRSTDDPRTIGYGRFDGRLRPFPGPRRLHALFDGSTYVIAWSGGEGGVAFSRVDRDGKPIDAEPLHPAVGGGWDACLSSANGTTLLVWRQDGLRGARIEGASTTHFVLGYPGRTCLASAAIGGQHVLLTREAGEGATAIITVDPRSGESRAVPLEPRSDPPPVSWPAATLAAGATDFLLAWPGHDGSVQARHIGLDGTALDAPSRVRKGCDLSIPSPAVVWDGARYLVVSEARCTHDRANVTLVPAAS